jgi:hypothetical protein
MWIKYFLLFSITLSCNVMEIAGVAETELGDNFKKGVDGLIHYYRFESGSAGSTRFDDAGGADLTDYTSTAGNTGVYGNSIDCSTATTPGGNGVLTKQGISEGVSPTGSYTVSFWAYKNGFAIGGIFEYGSMTIDATAAGAFQVSLDGGTTPVTTSVDVVASTWNHIAFVFNNSASVDYYVNGSFVANYSVTASGGTANALYVCYTPNTSGKFNGRLDSLGLFNRALSASEVSDLYNNTNGLD